MKFVLSFKFIVAVCLSLSMSNITQAAVAHKQMISTTEAIEAVDQFDRTQVRGEIEEILNQDEVKKALLANGVSTSEVQIRLANMSNTELHQMAGQLKEVRAGGDILVTILLVVLIIYLVRRI